MERPVAIMNVMKHLAVPLFVLFLSASPLFAQLSEEKRRQLALDALAKAGVGLHYEEGKQGLFLARIEMNGATVTDELVKNLGPLGTFHTLHLCETRITDAGLAVLKGKPALRNLYLTYNRITDAGILHLKELDRLEVLGLSFTNVGDDTARNVVGMKNLRTLCLSHTSITDQGVEAIKKLPRIQNLFLDGTLVTQAALPTLNAMPLISLSYSSTRAVKDGVEGFQKKIP